MLSPSLSKLFCGNSTPKPWTYDAQFAVLIYNNLPNSALDNHKSPNGAYGDSSEFSKFHVFVWIIPRWWCSPIDYSDARERWHRELSVFLGHHSFCISWRKDEQKDCFLDLQSQGCLFQKPVNVSLAGFCLKRKIWFTSMANESELELFCRSKQKWILDLINAREISLERHLKERQYAVFGCTRLNRMSTELSTGLSSI